MWPRALVGVGALDLVRVKVRVRVRARVGVKVRVRVRTRTRRTEVVGARREQLRRDAAGGELLELELAHAHAWLG